MNWYAFGRKKTVLWGHSPGGDGLTNSQALRENIAAFGYTDASSPFCPLFS